MAKLVAYEAARTSGSWTRASLLVADNNDSFDFEAASAEVAARLPPDMSVTTLALSQTDIGTAQRTLLDRLNDGHLLVNYIGHGATEVWAGENLLTTAEARMLRNHPRLPVVLSMTCLNGFFHDLYTESVAEALLKAEQGGAVAVWASSGLTSPRAQAVLNQAMIGRLFGEEPLTLGEASAAAKVTVTNRDVRRTWLLFGDPMIQLK